MSYGESDGASVKEATIYVEDGAAEPTAPVQPPADLKTPENTLEPALETTSDDFRMVERGSWKNKTEYLLTVIGYAVGLGNAWRFPYIAYSNGGGAFLIPYFTMLLCAGLPLAYIDVALGQFSGQSCFEAFNCVPILKGIGLSMVAVTVYLGIYYIVIIAYTLHYFILSFRSPLPWTSCNHTLSNPFCSEDIYNVTRTSNETCKVNCSISPTENYWINIVLQQSSGVADFGGIRGSLMLELLLAWTVVCLCTIKGTKSVGKVVYFTALFPYVAITALLIGVLGLDGATDGIYFLFKPTWGLLFTAKVWQEAATQIFFSLSCCLGGLITLSSYNSFHNNCFKDICIVAAVNSFTSIYAGISVFATLGIMAKGLGREISSVVQSGPGLAFVVYPQAVVQLPLPQLWAGVFFAMLITLGLDTMFAVTETVVSSISDGFPHIFHHRKAQLTTATCITFFLLGLIIVSRAGFYWLNLLDTFAAGLALLFIAVIEISVIAHVYGVKNFEDDLEMMLGKRPHIVWHYMWKYITPVVLFVIFCGSLSQVKKLTLGDYVYPIWANVLGWLTIISALAFVPGCAAYEIYKRKGTFLERVKNASKPNKLWRPFLDEDCIGKYAPLASKRFLEGTAKADEEAASPLVSPNPPNQDA